MDLDTWVSLGTIIATGAAITTLMLRAIGRLDNTIEAVDKNMDATRKKLETKIDRVNKNLDTKITAARKETKEGNDSLRESMEAAFGRIETRLTSLEQRTYDIKPGTSSQTG